MFERPRSGERAVLVRLGFGAAVDPEDLRELDLKLSFEATGALRKNVKNQSITI